MMIKETKYDGYYVDDQGNVYSSWRSCCKGTIKVPKYLLKQFTDKVGRKSLRIAGHSLRVHRLIYDTFIGIPEDLEIDHIDRDASNNKLDNLRLATHQDNQQNKRIRKNNTSGFKGVHLHKQSNMYQAYIMCPNGHHKYLGRYSTAKEAAQVYDEAAAIYFKQYAAPNKELL